jgi:hypothetical protein
VDACLENGNGFGVVLKGGKESGKHVVGVIKIHVVFQFFLI